MRLLTKTSLLIITVSIFIFLIGNIVFFRVTKHMIINQVDAELINKMHNLLKNNESLESNLFVTDHIEIDTNVLYDSEIARFSDTVLYSKIQNKYIPHRALQFSKKVNSNISKITIYKSLLSSDKLIEKITLASILMVVFFIIAIYALNRFIFEKVWSNFFRNLKKVENYDIKSSNVLSVEESEIDEFNKLNSVHLKMVERIQTDFLNLKELTANTSHEIQTPLAIVKSKAELLLQSDNLDETELNAVDSIITSIERLSKLNQSLLLITKIENNQFSDAVSVNVKEILDKHLQNFDMLFQSANVVLEFDITDLSIEINPILLDILIMNLLKNAIAYANNKKELSVVLKNNTFSVCNSGEALVFSPDDLFKRFVKGSSNQNSSGLGLEIVSRICKLYGISINYKYQELKHCFTIDFSNIACNSSC